MKNAVHSLTYDLPLSSSREDLCGVLAKIDLIGLEEASDGPPALPVMERLPVVLGSQLRGC